MLRLQALDLKVPRPASTSSKGGSVAFKVPGLLKKRKARKLEKKPTPFDKEARAFSMVALMQQFDYKFNYKALGGSNVITNGAVKAGFRFSPWCRPFKILNQPPMPYAYRHPQLWVFNYAALALFFKKSISCTRLPHRWGGQRGFLIKRWETGPKYFSLAPINIDTPFDAFIGSVRVNYPMNLATPKGPTLKDLWAYIKANPNEGY